MESVSFAQLPQTSTRTQVYRLYGCKCIALCSAIVTMGVRMTRVSSLCLCEEKWQMWHRNVCEDHL